jgi:predicted acyltransferase
MGSASRRLASVDALRGLTVAAMLVVNDAGDWSHVHPWLEHAAWNGIAPPDLIFPMFLFVLGVSVALALVPRVEAGADRRELARAVIGRALRIVLLGMALQWVAWLSMEPGRSFRVMGVLQRIGLCYAAVGLLAIGTQSGRMQWASFVALLLVYAALLLATGTLEPGLNLPDRIDTAVLGRHAYQTGLANGASHDPEGLLSTLPSIATAILGLRAGSWLRGGRARWLPVAGVAAFALGAAWSRQLPLNKNLWTPSFVLWTGGVSMLALALAHELVDRRGWPPLGRSLGVNAITAYALGWLAICALAGSGALGPLYATLFAAPLSGYGPPWMASVAFAVAFTAAIWTLMRWFDARGWRVTI